MDSFCLPFFYYSIVSTDEIKPNIKFYLMHHLLIKMFLLSKSHLSVSCNNWQIIFFKGM